MRLIFATCPSGNSNLYRAFNFCHLGNRWNFPIYSNIRSTISFQFFFPSRIMAIPRIECFMTIQCKFVSVWKLLHRRLKYDLRYFQNTSYLELVRKFVVLCLNCAHSYFCRLGNCESHVQFTDTCAGYMFTVHTSCPHDSCIPDVSGGYIAVLIFLIIQGLAIYVMDWVGNGHRAKMGLAW